MTVLTLYRGPGCSLCDEARAVVEPLARERGIELRELDVSLDPALQRAYGERIPVLAIDGDEAFELHVDERELRERLDRVAG